MSEKNLGLNGLSTFIFKSVCMRVRFLKFVYEAACRVFVPAADGTSDDIDVPLRKLFADPDLVRRHGLMSLNSVNWSRILVQLAHFLFVYLHLSAPRAGGDELEVLEVLVPTGGAGNITGEEQHLPTITAERDEKSCFHDR